jgi:hypothetical protein
VGAPLTQIFSDELGWRALEKQVAAVYRSLSPDERAKAAILVTNYGEAAALVVYGDEDRLPPALRRQNQYFLWGPHGYRGSIIIHVNGDPDRWRRECESLNVVGTFGVPYAMPYENGRPIFICRGLRRSLDENLGAPETLPVASCAHAKTQQVKKISRQDAKEGVASAPRMTLQTRTSRFHAGFLAGVASDAPPNATEAG